MPSPIMTSPQASTSTAPSPPKSATFKSNRFGRPCDACKRRKQRCVFRDGQEDVCVMCDFQNVSCTFTDAGMAPTPSRKRNPAGAGDNLVRKRRQKSKGTDEDAGVGNNGTSPTSDTTPKEGSVPAPVLDRRPPAPDSFLYRTLGLEKYRYSTYISANHPTLLPTLLLSLPFNPSQPLTSSSDEYKLNQATSLRRISHTELFLLTDDPGVEQDARDVDKIQSIVQGCGPQLVKLYFRIVHPSFPILHKGLWLEKFHRSIYELSPPLLAAVYLLALNWRNYAPTTLPNIDEKALEEIAQQTLKGVLSRPRLSTVQAALLLLLRRQIEGNSLAEGPGVGAFVGQLCAVGRVLGLHLDCTEWRIPVWERGLRRRLAWGLWMCDKWTALHLALPPFLPVNTWNVPMVTEEDFPEGEEDDNDEEGSVVVIEGREGFVSGLELARILGDILESDNIFFDDIPGLISVGRPFLARLENWRSNLPQELGMGSTRLRKLCSNASLHLSYHAIHLTLHRKIVTAIAAHHPGIDVKPPPGAFEKAREAAEQSVEWLSQIRPEHLEGFWYNAASNNLVLLGSFITLLQAVAFTSQDRNDLKKVWERLKWQLRIFSRGNQLFEGALRRVDDKRSWVETVLEKGFTPIPLGGTHRPAQASHAATKVEETNQIGAFPGFTTQNMEDLLSAEALATHGTQDGTHGFPDGFIGFEGFSGWQGFDINNM